MQLTSIGAVLALACLVGCTSSVSSETRAEGRHFADETVTVASPRVQSTITVEEDLTLSPYWKADVITAATPVMAAPDVVTRATEFSETRHEAGLGTMWQTEEHTELGGSYSLSVEPDYVSHSGSASVSREVLDRRATVGAQARVTADQVSRSDAEDFQRSLWGVSGDVSWTHIFNKTLVGRMVYSLEWRRGYQANPYRYVPVFTNDSDRPRFVLGERVPQLRVRHAGEVLGIWSVGPTTFLRAGYRLYGDDWGLFSHKGRLALWQEFFDELLRVRVRAEGYTQSGARFFESRYTRFQDFRTGDYRLSSMSTLSSGLRFDVRIDDVGSVGRLTLTASYDARYFDLPQYPVFDSMLAHMLGLSVALEVE